MRLQYAREVTRVLYTLGDAGASIRRAIEELQRTPRPPDVLVIPERPGYYELFVDGYWIGYRIDETVPAETVITIATVEEN